MLERKAYRSFSKKLNKILNDCKLSKEETLSRPLSTFYDDKGSWEETKNVHYFFDIEKVAFQ